MIYATIMTVKREEKLTGLTPSFSRGALVPQALHKMIPRAVGCKLRLAGLIVSGRN
jgi:hypothetical protein